MRLITSIRLRDYALRICRSNITIFLISAWLISTCMLWPLPLHLSDQTLDLGDTLQQTSTMRWVQDAWTDPQRSIWDTPTVYPAPASLSLYQPLYTSALLGMPVYLLGFSAATVFNVVIWLNFTLSCWAMCLLAYSLTHSRSAGLIAGILYAFSHVRWGHLAHLNLLSGFWNVFLLALLVRLWQRPPATSRQRWAYAAGLTLLITAQALADIYNALYMLAILGLWIIYQTLRGSWRQSRLPFGLLLASGAASLLLCLPVALPIYRTMQTLELQRPFNDHAAYSAHLEHYLVPAHASLLPYDLASYVQSIPDIVYAEQSLWPGLMTLILASIGLLPLSGSLRPERAFFGVLLLWALLLSFGPRLHLTHADQGIRSLPYQWIYENLPLFSVLRVPARWSLVAQLCLVVFAAYGLQTLLLGARRSFQWWPQTMATFIAGSFLVLSLLDSWHGPIQGTSVVVDEPIPTVYSVLATLPPGAVLEWPMVNADPTLPHRYGYYTMSHQHPIVNGAPSIIPSRYALLEQALRDFPTHATLDLLSSLGVRYININRWELSGWERLATELESLPALRRIGSYDDERHVLYELAASPATAQTLPLLNVMPTAAGATLTMQVASPLWLNPAANYYDRAQPYTLTLRQPNQQLLSVPIMITPVVLPGFYQWPIPATASASEALLLGNQWLPILDDPRTLIDTVTPEAQLFAQQVPATIRAGDTLAFGLYGKGPIEQKGAILTISLMTDHGRVVAKKDLLPSQGVPPHRWPDDQFIPLDGTLTVPASLESSAYFVGISLFDPRTQTAIPFAGPDGTHVAHMWRLHELVMVVGR